jgi:hypothetical protein
MRKLILIAGTVVLLFVAAALSARAQTVSSSRTPDTPVQRVIATPLKATQIEKRYVAPPPKAQITIAPAPDVVPRHAQKVFVAPSSSVAKPLQPATANASIKMKDEK